MLSIDRKNLEILAESVDNSKSTFAGIGKKLSIHPNVVAYRVKKMEQDGIITEYTTRLDLEKLGLTEHICASATFPQFNERDRVLKEISRIPQIFRVFSLLGTPGLMIFIIGKTKAEVNETISKLRELNMNIENAVPIVRIYRDWLPGYFFKSLSEQPLLKR
ncbi:MAG: Lrp/AsnC family transcriptional regulator [Candidatus Bathyarchaeota archaeon]